MKLFKKVIDERQELEFLRIERMGFWVLFWGLVIAIHVQIFVYNSNLQQIAGESILLLISSLVMLIGYLRKGLWSSYANPTAKSNLLYSLAISLIFGFISTALRYKRLSATESVVVGKLLPLFIVRVLIMFAVCFALYSICAAIVNKRKAKLETYFDESGND